MFRWVNIQSPQAGGATLEKQLFWRVVVRPAASAVRIFYAGPGECTRKYQTFELSAAQGNLCSLSPPHTLCLSRSHTPYLSCSDRE